MGNSTCRYRNVRGTDNRTNEWNTQRTVESKAARIEHTSFHLPAQEQDIPHHISSQFTQRNIRPLGRCPPRGFGFVNLRTGERQLDWLDEDR